jgi:hypothetical protein
MPSSLQLNLPPSEVKRSHRAPKRSEEPSPSLDVPLRMAKAQMGAAVTAAIGDAPLEQFGHEGQMSAVCSGEKVPDYLARIYEDEAARVRFAKALLKGCRGVRLREVFEIEEVA